MKKNYVALSESKENALRKAEATYTKTMIEFYPIGSCWMCNHGTHGEYKVEIKSFIFCRGGFIVENTKTHKTKIVHWSSLRCVA